MLRTLLLFNILIQNIIQVFGVFYLYTLYMIDYHYGIQ